MGIAKRFLIASAKTILVIALFFGAYSLWVRSDVKSVRNLCSEISPGMSLSDLPALLEKHGFDGALAGGRMKTIAVVAPSTMGEVVCMINNNGTVVTSASMIDE